MDTSIRSLINTALKHTGTGPNQALRQAYNILRSVAQNRPSTDETEAFNLELYVLCSETAFQYGMIDAAKECLKMYFMKPPPADQFLCRAYLCQAQLMAPKDANNPAQLEKSVVYIIKAITLAKQKERYHFLVYNASVIYWQFCRPFLKPGYRQYLARALHQVVKGLDDIDDKDYEWRAELMMALIECHLDAGRRSDASHIATAAAAFIRQNVPSMFKQVFGLMVHNQLVESSKLHKDIKNSPELSVYYKICKLKLAAAQKEQREYYSEIQGILNQIGISNLNISSSMSLTSTERISRKESKLSTRDVSPNTSNVASTTSVKDDDTPTVKRSGSKTGRRTPTPTSSKKLAVDSAEKPHLLLELGRFCLQLNFADLAEICSENIKLCNIKDQKFYLELEFLECETMVKILGDKQESYQKAAVDTRIQAMKRCEEAILNAVRLGDPNIIQVGCVTQWNLSLPLQQANLRNNIRKHLIIVAEALEDIQSLLIQLRCQVHTELSRCEEDEEQIQVAMQHLKKALVLDDGNVYKERLEVTLHRLQMRSELYKQPERPEDQAAMIIEQARSCDSGTIRMKRSLLVKAGEALSPDAFLLVLDSESETRETTGKGPQTIFRKLGAKAQQFNKCVKKAEGHLKRLGDENDRERARLWADLAKTARKYEVWDVCRVAAKFAILYDDDRWKFDGVESSGVVEKKTESKDVKDETGTGTELDKKSASRIGSRPGTPDPSDSIYSKDLLRILAEVHFIFGEAYIHLLRSEKVELNNSPIPPEDTRKRPKGYVAKKPEEDSDWLEYCDWIKMLSCSATKSFLRGLTLGVTLGEAWLVCSAATYIWNYNNHILSENRHREILNTLTEVLDGLKKVGHSGETVMLVNICNALATSLISPWIPTPAPKEVQEPSVSPTPTEKPGGKKAARANVGTAKSKAGVSVTISPDAQPDLKKAVEVCEYGMAVTNGDNNQDVVNISVRQPLLQTWVTAKQMSLQQITKTFGTEDEINMDDQKGMTKSIVVIEMAALSKNGIMEFKEVPSLSDIFTMVESCRWTEKFIELQLWTKLTFLAFNQKQHALVLKCSQKALRFVTVGTQPKNRKMDPHRYTVEQEMLSYTSCILGQSLMENMAGKNSIRRQALEAFLNSARYARNAKNYNLVMSAARHYWNACVSLVSQPIERELLKEPVRVMLQCITATAEQATKKEDKNGQQGQGDSQGPASLKTGKKTDNKKDEEEKSPRMVGGSDDDLSLRAALYGVLFQAYSDKGEWEESLDAMDQAITDMPRTKHRLLIFKHRVMVKARLGRDVSMDIQKFKDENEDYVAHMWRRVALSSKVTSAQLTSYQNAIEALTKGEFDWLKIDYLLEFGQWLYSNQFPIADCIDQVEWAIDILLNMKYDPPLVKKEDIPVIRKMTKKDTASSSNISSLKKDKKKGGKSSAQKPKSEEVEKTTAVEEVKDENFDKNSKVGSDSINPEDYVPVNKQAEIGVVITNTNQTVEDLTDIQQLDYLVRAHVILAQFHGRGSQAYKDSLLMAVSYLQRIWQVSVTYSGPTLKELAKNPVPETAVSGKNSAKSKGKKDKEKEVVKEKPKRKGPLDVLPSCIEEWAVYDVPDEVLEAFNHESMNKLGVNTNTFKKPMLTSHYLDELVSELRALGYNQLTLPILAFQDLLSRSLFKDKTMTTLVHIRLLEVCYELDLKAGCNFHEKIVGNMEINEEDQAQSREEIALWKERQVQVAREELRVKESLTRLAFEGRVEKRTLASRTTMLPTTEEKDSPTINHLGKVLGAVSRREIWTETAKILIRLGYYQPARIFLNEANIAATAFGDEELQSDIMYTLGQLAYNEAQYGQAINLCRVAQDLHQGNEMFWYKTTMLMVDATLKDYENKNSKRIARKIVISALNEFTQIYEERPNRMGTLCFIIASLEAKLASIQAGILMSGERKSTVPRVMKGLLSACEKYESSIEKMLKLDYKCEALPYIKQHAEVLNHIAREAIESEIKHTYLLQALTVLKEGVIIAEEIYRDSYSLSSLQDIRGTSLPIQRMLADIQIACGQQLVEILRLQTSESRNRQLDDERKGSVMLLVEEFVRETPTYTHMERDWLNIKQTAGEEALQMLINSHSLAGNILNLRAKSLLGLGSCLHIIGQGTSPNSPPQWLVTEMDEMNMKSERSEEEEGAKDYEETKQTIKYSQQIKDKQMLHENSKFYFLQACECLVQSLNISLHNRYMPQASQAARELVELLGQFDASSCSQVLALYQSCETAVNIENLLLRSQLDPSTSKLSALLHQRSNILDSDIQTNLSSSALMMSVNASLSKDWQAWKRLEVQQNHLDLLREFPSNFDFIILQHSSDRSFLYGAILDRPKTGGAAGGKGGKQHTSSGPGRAKVFGVKTRYSIIRDLIEKFRAHKQSVQQLLLKQEYQRTQAALRNKMLQNIDIDIKQEAKVQTLEDEAEGQRLQEDFRNIVAAMETYLEPVMKPIRAALRPTGSPIGSTANLSKEPKDHASSPECVIILADELLLELPLEALDSLKDETISSLSRDFSLQMFYHRFHHEPIQEDVNADKNKKKGKDASNPISRIPGIREAKQKQAKIVPLERQIQPWQYPVDTMNFRYMVDCYDDCAETEENKPIAVFNSVLEEYEQQFTPRWLGLTGQEHPPSVGEWEVYLKESSSMIFYGMERLLSYIPPSKLSALNIKECEMLYCLDLAQTNRSFLRQSKTDILKSHNDLSLEKPVQTAMLASLTGVKCVLANQWPCTLAENASKLKVSMKDLLKNGKTTGQMVRLIMSPSKRAKEEKAEAEAREAETSPTQKHKDHDKHEDKASKAGGSPVGGHSQSGRESVLGAADEVDTSIRSSSFNLVCYGLPNLVITQVS